MNTMDPINQHANVRHRIDALTAEAAAERLAARERRRRLAEQEFHPTLPSRHASAGVRGTVGRLLIGLGTAIAGTASEADTGRVA
jgi:hypothetical protein